MYDEPTRSRGTVIMSVALHAVLVVVLTAGFRFPSRPVFPAAAVPIQGVMIDESVITKEQQRRERVAHEEQQRKQREERQARERVEQQRRDKEAAAQRERDRVADEQRKAQAERERVAKEEKERVEAAKREKERVAQEKLQKEQRDREEAARKQKEAAAAKQRAQAEAELQTQLAAEAERQSAIANGLQDQYIRLIADKVERNWNKPLNATQGLECIVNVVQIPGGDVVDAKVGRCNGDDVVRRSIEDAVRKASPLPAPPSSAVFQRNLIFVFKPAS